MDFVYFKGSNSDMNALLEGRNRCSICNNEHDYCFDLEYTITDKFVDEEKEGKIGCYNCLRKGKFEFWHDTEFGMLDENGLSKVYRHNMDSGIRPTMSSNAVIVVN
ncbi:MAG: hypothetical protein EOP45_13505 [Sphingobacteriaceae bacterium]|nr:MAG: hypothetical protein EOP45_13505 [Sphingobacteriaceae bacterium]